MRIGRNPQLSESPTGEVPALFGAQSRLISDMRVGAATGLWLAVGSRLRPEACCRTGDRRGGRHETGRTRATSRERGSRGTKWVRRITQDAEPSLASNSMNFGGPVDTRSIAVAALVIAVIIALFVFVL